MSELFFKILNMSISASFLIPAVLLIRLVFKKAPKWVNVLLWGIVALRLILPFSIESELSLLPESDWVKEEAIQPSQPSIDEIIVPDTIVTAPDNGPGNTVIIQPSEPNIVINKGVSLPTVLSYVWLSGIALLLIYTAVSYAKLRAAVREAVIMKDETYGGKIYMSENIPSPFVLGVLRPGIYLPYRISPKDISHVIAHERAHIRRKDHLWKPLGFILLAVHWFNPLMWLCYILLCRDIEMACDEKVIKTLENTDRADYSEALLNCSVNRRVIAACPLAFGEVGVKSRVKSVLNYKRPAFWIIAAAITVSIVLAVCFLTNPKKDSSTLEYIGSQSSISDVEGVKLEIISAELSAPDPFLEVRITNESDKDIIYGGDFYIYQKTDGKFENCSIDKDRGWHLVAHEVTPGKSSTFKLKLNGFIMTEPGEYRIEKTLTVNKDTDPKYKAAIEFELEKGVDAISVHTFEAEEIVYTGGTYSFVQTVENTPAYMLINGMQLIEKRSGIVGEMIGSFEEITISKNSFDSRFSSSAECWAEGYSTETIKQNNKRIWQLCAAKKNDISELFVLLEQNDGSFYLGYGYYNAGTDFPVNPDDSHIRWLYRLKKVDKLSDGSTESTGLKEVNLSQLRDTHPHLFNISTDGGLTVYIWQMAEGYYECHLANTFLEAISDNSFAYPIGSVTIAEMRAILTTYEIDRKDITLHPVNNPLSSYHYVIDDEYRRNIYSLFWGEKMLEDTPTADVYDPSQPPKLTVLCGNNSTAAVMGTTSWTFKTGDGTAAVLEGDSAHPLDRLDYLLPLSLRIDDMDKASNALRLIFEISPDSFEVNSWFIGTNGEIKSFDSETTGKAIILNPAPEPCIYEVVAHWTEGRNYSGTVRYAFCVEEKREPDSSSEYDAYGIKTDILFRDANNFELSIERDSTTMSNYLYSFSPEYTVRAVTQDRETISLSDYMYISGHEDYTEPDIAWDDVLYTLKPGEKIVMQGNLNVTYGELPAGNYVICKAITQKTDGTEADFIITVPFSVVD